MAHALFSMPLAHHADVVRARLATRRALELLGLDRPSQTRVATAVSEVARNAVMHGGGGELRFSVDAVQAPTLLEVEVSDQGPGIACLEELLRGERVFEGGLGKGLQSARRLVHDFDIRSAPGAGTLVRLRQRLPRESTLRLGPRELASLAGALPSQPADPLVELREQDLAVAESLAGLQARDDEAERLNRELEETNRGVVALYSELDHKAEQLRQASDLKSRFLSHMSHEFRTPLSSILALSRLLLDRVDGPLSVEQERQIDYIRRSAQGLLEMVNDLLDLAKVEAGKLEVKASRFTVAELFGSLRGSLKPLQQGRGVELVFEEPHPGLPELHTDEAKVTQILRNFVSNALKFTERGRVSVRALAESDGRRLRLSVQDSGIGIRPEDRERIFEEFSQVDGLLQQGGTGLGLPLSRRLAELLGGEILLDSAPGVGSTFTLRLPVRWGEAAVVPRDAAAGCVLVVDDEESFRYVIRHIAQDAGWTVLEAEDGVEGMQLAVEARPSVIVLDLNMPRMDGYAVLAALQTVPEVADTPVIVCTSQALTLDQKRLLARSHAIVAKHDLSRDGLIALISGLMPAAHASEEAR